MKVYVKTKARTWAGIVAGIGFGMLGWLAPESGAASRPNIVLIMADDMGWSDIGCYGSEIRTPHLDRLAAHGLRFTQFYNTGRCCPTRASLLTGLYPHQAGVGHMTGDAGPAFPGYRGRLNRECVAIAEALRPAGYFTAITGKWHVGAKDKAWWPLQRGFDRFYGVPQGGGFYFKPKKGRDVVLNNEIVIPGGSDGPPGWYSTDAWTDYGIRFIDEARAAGKPFFLYLAFNAPHWPLQIPKEEIGLYRGAYAKGWDAVRADRYERQRQMGLLDKSWPLSPPNRVDREWPSLTPEEQAHEQQAMEVYAAVVEHMDRAIGRLVEALQSRGLLENTVIMFLSDNGGCAEGGPMAVNRPGTPPYDPTSHLQYGKSWANASNTPFRMFKHYVHEGGISTPLVVHWPAGIPRRLEGSFCRQPAHVIDLMATCLDLARADYPKTYNGHTITPLEGRSMVPLWQGSDKPIHEALFWEHEGNRAVRVGDWKLVALRGKPWELYNLGTDRTELHDLAAEQSARVKRMAALWEQWAKRAHVLPSPSAQKSQKKPRIRKSG